MLKLPGYVFVLRSLLFLVVLFIIYPRKGAAQSTPVRHYTVDDGLSSNTVYDMVQDSRGFIWFATSAGVSRFDGNNFVRYAIEDGLSDNDVLKIVKDSEGRLWVSGFNSTVTVIEGDSIHNGKRHPLLKKITADFFYRSIYEIEPGEMVLSNRRSSSPRIRFPDKITYGPPLSDIIFRTSKGEIDAFKPTVIVPDEKGDTMIIGGHQKPIFNNYVFNDSLLFINTGSNIIRIDRNHHASILNIPQHLLSEFLEIYCDPDLGIWVNSSDRGVTYFPYNDGSYGKYKTYFPKMNVTSVFRDNEKNMWFSTHGNGVFMMSANFTSAISYTTDDGLEDNEANSIFRDSKGRIWIGHRNALLEMISNGVVHKIKLHNDLLSVDRVLRITEHPSGYLFAASDAGLFQLKVTNDDKVEVKRQLMMPNSSRSSTTRRLAIKDVVNGPDSSLIVASIESLHIITADKIGNTDSALANVDFPVKRYYTALPDGSGGLWYADAAGLHHKAGDKITDYAEIEPLLANRVADIARIGPRAIVSLEGYGLIIIENGTKISRLTTANGLLSNHCGKMFLKGEKVYICTNKGVNVLSFDQTGTPALQKITTADGLLSNQVNDVFVDDSLLYAASQRGVSLIRLNLTGKVRQSVPRIYIMSVSWQGQTLPLKSDKIPVLGNGNLQFQFLSPYFAFPEGIQYQYRLNDQPWINIPAGTMEFNSLQPGDYTFDVRARHLDSPWSEPATYAFVVPQPFYLSLWFYVLLFVTSVAIVMILYRRSARRMRKEQQVKLEYEQHINRLQGQSLQAMMNPHFIFNSLNAIQQEINAGHTREAGTYLSRFARLLRINLQTINEEYITLKEELERINLYMDTEKMRLRERLDFSIEVDPSIVTDEVMIPSMIIQPFLENSIWHGIMPFEKGGAVRLKFRTEGDQLVILIDDNGVGINDKGNRPDNGHVKSNFGINLTRKRLELITLKTGRKAEVDLRDKMEFSETGTLVTIRIPLIRD